MTKLTIKLTALIAATLMLTACAGLARPLPTVTETTVTTEVIETVPIVCLDALDAAYAAMIAADAVIEGHDTASDILIEMAYTEFGPEFDAMYDEAYSIYGDNAGISDDYIDAYNEYTLLAAECYFAAADGAANAVNKGA